MPVIILLRHTLEAKSLTILINLPYKRGSTFSVNKTYTRHVLLILLPFNKLSGQLNGRPGQAKKHLQLFNRLCNNDSSSHTGSAIANKTFEALEQKLAKLAIEKQRLAFANQVRLAKLELVNLHHGTPLSTPTINKPSRHT